MPTAQTLILYGTYRLAKRMPGGDAMAAITRILHRSSDDELSPFVPTYRVDPLRPACDTASCAYPAGDRPNAVRKFLDAVKREPSLIKVRLWRFWSQARRAMLRCALLLPA